MIVNAMLVERRIGGLVTVSRATEAKMAQHILIMVTSRTGFKVIFGLVRDRAPHLTRKVGRTIYNNIAMVRREITIKTKELQLNGNPNTHSLAIAVNEL